MTWPLSVSSACSPPPPRNIAWSLTKIKILGVYIGHGDLAEAKRRPPGEAVDRCLKSLSFSGKALVGNSLALSRVWYVASLVHMPAWVCAELKKLLFIFFWSGKRDLVARKVLIHPKGSGGFSVVSVQFKVAALLIQWFCRLVVCPNGWCISLLIGCWVDTVSLLLPFSLILLPFLMLCFLLFTLIFFRPGVLLRVGPLLRASPLAPWAAMPARLIPSLASQPTPFF